MKKYGKMSLIFEFSMSRLVYVAILIKIQEKNLWPTFKPFLTNRGKNGNEDEKIWKNEFHVSILYIKIRLYRKSWENFFDSLFKRLLTLFKDIF